jgi:hypothetical protein
LKKVLDNQVELSYTLIKIKRAERPQEDLKMENFTAEQISAIKNYLTAKVALDKHLETAKVGYNQKFTDAVGVAVDELKKVFDQDEVSFITNGGCRDELVKAFLG